MTDKLPATMCKCGTIFTNVHQWEAHIRGCPVLIGMLRSASGESTTPRVQLMYSDMYPTRYSSLLDWLRTLGVRPVKLPAIASLNGMLASGVTVTLGWYVPSWVEIIMRQEDLETSVRGAAIRRGVASKEAQAALVALMREAGDAGLSGAVASFAGGA